jgi:hypothetical protein
MCGGWYGRGIGGHSGRQQAPGSIPQWPAVLPAHSPDTHRLHCHITHKLRIPGHTQGLLGAMLVQWLFPSLSDPPTFLSDATSARMAFFWLVSVLCALRTDCKQNRRVSALVRATPWHSTAAHIQKDVWLSAVMARGAAACSLGVASWGIHCLQ